MLDASEIALEIRMGTSSLVQPKAQEWTVPQCILRSTAAGGKGKQWNGLTMLNNAGSERNRLLSGNGSKRLVWKRK